MSLGQLTSGGTALMLDLVQERPAIQRCIGM